MRAMTDNEARVLFASERADDCAGGRLIDSRSPTGAGWEPMLPSMRHARIRVLMGIADVVERSAAAVGRAGWLAPIGFATLVWLGVSAT